MRNVLSVIYEPDRDEFLVNERIQQTGRTRTVTLAAFRTLEDAHRFMQAALHMDLGNELGVIDSHVQSYRSAASEPGTSREASGSST